MDNSTLTNDTVIIDSREKPRAIGGIIGYFDQAGIRHVTSKLICGDYQLLSNGRLAVDRKQGLAEVYSNLTAQHERLRAELVRAQELGIRLVILVVDDRHRDLASVKHWTNPRIWNYCKAHGIPTGPGMRDRIREYVGHGGQKPPLNGDWLFKAMDTVAARYGVIWEFCRHDQAGQRILELLAAGKTTAGDPEHQRGAGAEFPRKRGVAHDTQ